MLFIFAEVYIFEMNAHHYLALGYIFEMNAYRYRDSSVNITRKATTFFLKKKKASTFDVVASIWIPVTQ